jgi:cytoskeletal protein CcmA (bactofilin family)
MFKNDIKDSTLSVDTIIGPTVSVEGNFKGDGNIIVEGEVKGTLKTKGYLKATESSIITANINVGSAEIAGQLAGNIKVRDNLDIKEKAVITGDIETGMLSINYGAIVNGNLKMKIDNTSGHAGIVINENEENKK